MTVGERIRNRRIELGLSQSELASKMGYSDKTGISKAETCGDNITTTKICKFADALDCTFDYLMGWEEKTPLTKEYANMLAKLMKNKELAESILEIVNNDECTRQIIQAHHLSDKKKESLFNYNDFLSSSDD